MNPGTKDTFGSGWKVSLMSGFVSSKSTMCLLNCLTVLMNLRESKSRASRMTFETISDEMRSP